MYVLGVDTSTDFLSVALCDDARTLAESTFDAGRTHAEKIMDTVDEVLARAGVPMRDIGLLAVTRGPGSFTGIRIAGQARDRLGKLLAVGVVAMLFSHVFINIGMNIRIMPVTGVPLPLLSYGGSSVLGSLIAMGILQNVYIHRKTY